MKSKTNDRFDELLMQMVQGDPPGGRKIAAAAREAETGEDRLSLRPRRFLAPSTSAAT